MRKLYWYLTAYIRKKGFVFILAVALGIVTFSVLVPTLFGLMDRTKTEYIGLIGEFTIDNLPHSIKEELSAGLTGVNPDGSVSPLLASRWAVEQEGTSYRFLLQDGLTWNDGKKVSPEDIQYAFKDVERIVSSQDIVFKLPSAYAPFPSMVSDPVLKTGSLSQFGWWKKPTRIGIGPNRISNYDRIGDRLRSVTIVGPEVKKQYRFYLTESDAIDAFKQGKVDTLPELFNPNTVMEWPQVKTSKTILPNRYLAAFFNHQDSRLQKNIRQALSYAASKPADERRAYGPISASSWAFFSGGKEYNQDYNRALERLFDELPREKLEFTLTTTPLYEQQAKQLKQDWEELGRLALAQCQEDSKVKDKSLCPNVEIKINEKIISVPDKSDFDILLIGQVSPDDPDQYSLWHSDQADNFSHYKNTRIDTLLEKGRQTIDQQERLQIYQEFQQYLLEDAAAVFLQQLESFAIERK